MIKGGNAFVPSVPLRIAVRAGVDAAALLLTDDGRVRGDQDVVFHGAPEHPSGAVRLSGPEDGTAWLDVGLTSVEEDIARVLVVAATESGAMRDVAGLSVEAFAPDGTSVVRYDVTDAGGETAMVLAELYRRAGGWKFRAVGQGYLDGLAALAADHGVEVAEDAMETAPAGPAPTPTVVVPQTAQPVPAVMQTPQPLPAAVQIPQSTPQSIPAAAHAPAAVASPAPVPPATPEPFPAHPRQWTFGPVFEPWARSGRDNDVIAVDGLPPGPVVVELAVRGEGYTGLWTLDGRNKDKDNLVNSTEDDFRGRLLTTVPGSGRLRLRLRADGPWHARVLPLAEARTLTEEWLEGGGPEVLLHTAGAADLSIHYRGDDNLIVHTFELAGYEDPTTLPRQNNVVNEIGRRRETVPLPEGPLIVAMVRSDGAWRARLKDVQALAGPPGPGQSPQVTWAGAADGPRQASGVRKMQSWLRRNRW
ncbi:TerD family protein [Streptomyces griseosporeus]